MHAARVVPLLLVLPLLVPVTQAQPRASGEFAATDGSGDVVFGPSTPQPGFPPAMPSTVVTDYVDLTGLRVYDESLEGIHVAVALKTLSKSPVALTSHQIEITFGAQSSPPVSYTLRWFEYYNFFGASTNPAATNRTFDHAPSLCFYNSPTPRGTCLSQRVIGWIDYENNQLVAFVPKSSLQGIDPLRPEHETPVTVSMPSGTRLGNFTVESLGDLWSDRLPDQGEVGPYVLQQPTANQRLRVRLFTNETAQPREPISPGQPSSQFGSERADFPHVAVEPGAPFAVPIEIRNLNGAKRLVNVTIEYTQPKDASKWPVRIAPSLQIPGNETRVVNLVVNATRDLKHRDETEIRVVARSVGFNDEVGVQTLRLVGSVPPSPEHRKLFLHAVAYPSGGAFDSCSFPGPFLYCYGHTFLNTLEEDEVATGDGQPARGGTGIFTGGTGAGSFASGTAYTSFDLEQPLARDLVLDINKDVTGEIRLGATQAFEGSLVVNLRAGDIFVGGATIPVTGTGSQDPIVFQFLPLTNSERLPRAAELRLQIEITYSYVGTGAALLVEPPGVVPKGSFFELPVIPDPRATNLSLGSQDSLISLTVKGDRDDFVNPGESRAFNITLINEGTETDNINVTGFIESGKCAIQIKPGQRFRLDAGDSARLGVLLRAHSEAKEGDRCLARIQAHSEADPDVYASLVLEAVVTNGIDLGDDTENYTADSDSAQKLQKEEGGRSPGVGPVATLIAALAVLAGRRRPGRA